MKSSYCKIDLFHLNQERTSKELIQQGAVDVAGQSLQIKECKPNPRDGGGRGGMRGGRGGGGGGYGGGYGGSYGGGGGYGGQGGWDQVKYYDCNGYSEGGCTRFKVLKRHYA